jgi:hypothetical protein
VHGLPPGERRIVSPYDPDARNSVKRDTAWAGYKVHLSETCCEPGPGGARTAPNLITAVATTLASVPDVVIPEPVHDLLDAAGLLPAEHVADAGYASADLLIAARARGVALIGPLLTGHSAQARNGGYTADAFTICWDSRQVTCPQGAVSSKWAPMRKRDGKEAISVGFPAATCRACPARASCTSSARLGRQLLLRPREIHEAVAAARAAQSSQHWKNRYNLRAGVEGTIRQATHVAGIRRARYLGLAKTTLEHQAAAAAINLIRLDAWWTGKPLDRTRTTHLQRLDLAA